APTGDDNDLGAFFTDVARAGDAAQAVLAGQDGTQRTRLVARQPKQPKGLAIGNALIVLGAGNAIGAVATGDVILNIVLRRAGDGDQRVLKGRPQVDGAIAV